MTIRILGQRERDYTSRSVTPKNDIVDKTGSLILSSTFINKLIQESLTSADAIRF